MSCHGAPAAPNGCVGDCCVAFTLPKEPTDPIVIDMVIPITQMEAIARHQRMGNRKVIDKSQSLDTSKWYKCRHWDEETRLCGIYEDRPKMCRDYPYDKGCVSCDFTSDPDIIQEYVDMRARSLKEDT